MDVDHVSEPLWYLHLARAWSLVDKIRITVVSWTPHCKDILTPTADAKCEFFANVIH
jgi:hypothetical protein